MAPVLEQAPDPEEAPTRTLAGVWQVATSAVALAMAGFVLHTALWGPWPPLVNRALFVGLGFILTFTLYPLRKGRPGGVGLVDLAGMAVGVAGSILPPIMGAGAFVMAELLQIPYRQIALAAIIPALLYYLGVGATIHFEAKKTGLRPVPREMIPPLRQILTWEKAAPLFIPLAILVCLLLIGRSPQLAACWATVAAVVLHVFLASWRLLAVGLRALGALRALEAGGRGLVMLAFLGASAQIIIGMITLTGAGIKLSELLIAASGGHLEASLRRFPEYRPLVVCEPAEQGGPSGLASRQ